MDGMRVPLGAISQLPAGQMNAMANPHPQIAVNQHAPPQPQQQQHHPQTQQQHHPHPPPQPHPTPQPQPQQQQQQQIDVDPVNKFKNLLPQMKDSLVNLFKVGGHLFYQNANQDETGVHIDKVSGRFEESMESFYSICDQIEIQLRLAQEIVQQDKDSRTNTPISVVPTKNDASQSEGQLYSQYISTVRAQISCAKDIKDLLHDGLNNFQDHSHP